jgi:hypothetical protein
MVEHGRRDVSDVFRVAEPFENLRARNDVDFSQGGEEIFITCGYFRIHCSLAGALTTNLVPYKENVI